MKISKRRREMGEDAWAEYQRQRKNAKSEHYRQKNVEKVIRSRQKKKRILIEYKGGKCTRCELKIDIPDVYDFHHRDPNEKEFGLAQNSGKNLSLERCKKEADKCDLLCKNCHAIVHYELREKERAGR